MDWFDTPLGLTIVLVGIAWIAVSCVFAVVFGRLISRMKDTKRSASADERQRLDPRRVPLDADAAKPAEGRKTSVG